MPADLHLDAGCDHEIGCITCGDEAVAMRVLEIDEARGLALCAAEDDSTSTVESSLVDGVGAGDLVLVHAGVALQRLAAEPEGVRA
jgi:hydrogenase maturation factor